MTKRSKKTLVDGSPFYLTIKNLGREKLTLSSAKWFKCQPMGVSKLNTLIRDCSKAAGLATDKRITYYSARKTLVQKLRDSDVPPTEIVQITGHKNLQSINNYSSSGEKQQMAISTLLSTACSSTSVSQQLQSQTVPQPVTQQEFSSTFVPTSTSTMVNESPQRKKFLRLRVLDSQEMVSVALELIPLLLASFSVDLRFCAFLNDFFLDFGDSIFSPEASKSFQRAQTVSGETLQNSIHSVKRYQRVSKLYHISTRMKPNVNNMDDNEVPPHPYQIEKYNTVHNYSFDISPQMQFWDF
ncbi:hypothetical protein pdam_00010332 [Pocillopora damicornis]|uniref:Tyr recombinase domain-containing protein n=1 Tax=Pocillopora damicornis TaxID=46731 RepID=A0A3M6UD15_POCDA|nr:hypothetical protein pdam_00010332 [Pocillopora damicornis]